MSDKRYWLWLQQCIGVAKPFDKILDSFGSIEALYKSDYTAKRLSGVLSDKIIDKMHTLTLDDMDRIINECRANDWSIITYDDEDYPSRLREIYAPPAVLYVDGDISTMHGRAVVGIVGTREASPYALKSAAVLSKGIARCNIAVVSGGALGVDTQAHEGALACDGITYAVLGCGLGTRYLMQNEELRRRITLRGALITEFPPYTPATKYTFPTRNRLISGISDGLVVVEAGEKSGSMITASYALSQSRDVFAVACSMLDEKFSGTNRLISEGAIVATSPERIVEHYKSRFPSVKLSGLASVRELLSEEYEDRDIAPEEDEQITFENIDMHRSMAVQRASLAGELKGNDSIVYNALTNSFDELDAIISRAGIEASLVMISLTLLEMQGLAESTLGKRFRRKN